MHFLCSIFVIKSYFVHLAFCHLVLALNFSFFFFFAVVACIMSFLHFYGIFCLLNEFSTTRITSFWDLQRFYLHKISETFGIRINIFIKLCQDLFDSESNLFPLFISVEYCQLFWGHHLSDLPLSYDCKHWCFAKKILCWWNRLNFEFDLTFLLFKYFILKALHNSHATIFYYKPTFWSCYYQTIMSLVSISWISCLFFVPLGFLLFTLYKPLGFSLLSFCQNCFFHNNFIDIWYSPHIYICRYIYTHMLLAR